MRSPTGAATLLHLLRAIAHTRAILRSAEFEVLRRAARERRFAEIGVVGRRIVFEPDLPVNRCGMTLAGESGFLVGPRAFTSREELVCTVLQEVFRLDHGGAGRPVDALAALDRTIEARRFAERAWALGRTLALL